MHRLVDKLWLVFKSRHAILTKSKQSNKLQLMAFEKFIAKKGRFTPQVTINKSGGLGLSSGMHHRYKLDDYAGVELYFDKEAQTVGIKLVEKESDGMFRLKKRANEKGAYFSARSFLASYSIDPK